MGYLTSGNAIVDRMGEFNIRGNIIPQIWYKTIVRDNGKPYLLGITLLADIVYWYRPTEVRDEQSGNIIGWKKRFHGDILQKSYQQYAELFGESKRTIKAAMDRLEQLGVIKRTFRDVQTRTGGTLRNVMYIELLTDGLKEITYPDELVDNKDEKEQEEVTYDGVVQNFVPRPTVENDKIAEKSQLVEREGESIPEGTTKFCTTYDRTLYDVPQNDVPCGTEKCGINTKNTTEITYRDYPIYPSGCTVDKKSDMIDTMDITQSYIELIKENIEYEHHMRYDDDCDKKMYDELFEIICDVVCVKRNTIRIGKEDYPYELVKSKFLKLNSSHLAYVMNCMQRTTTEIKNIKAYMVTTLYNAPNTMNHYYQQEVQHDMYGGGWNEKGII